MSTSPTRTPSAYLSTTYRTELQANLTSRYPWMESRCLWQSNASISLSRGEQFAGLPCGGRCVCRGPPNFNGDEPQARRWKESTLNFWRLPGMLTPHTLIQPHCDWRQPSPKVKALDAYSWRGLMTCPIEPVSPVCASNSRWVVALI